MTKKVATPLRNLALYTNLDTLIKVHRSLDPSYKHFNRWRLCDHILLSVWLGSHRTVLHTTSTLSLTALTIQRWDQPNSCWRALQVCHCETHYEGGAYLHRISRSLILLHSTWSAEETGRFSQLQLSPQLPALQSNWLQEHRIITKNTVS